MVCVACCSFLSGVHLVTWSLFLALEESKEGDTGNFDDLKSDTWDITDGVARSTESGDPNFVVFFDVVQRTIIWDESGDPFTVLDELDSNAFSNSRVWLFSFDSDFLDDDSFGVGAASEGVGFQGGSQMSFLVVKIGPSLEPSVVSQLSCAFDTSWLVSHVLWLFFCKFDLRL